MEEEMETVKLSEEWCGKIYDVLSSSAGAARHEKKTFTRFVQGQGVTNWRFAGKLKDGGTINLTPKGWYVSCYPEHLNDNRRKVISETNYALQKLWKEFSTAEKKEAENG